MSDVDGEEASMTPMRRKPTLMRARAESSLLGARGPIRRKAQPLTTVVAVLILLAVAVGPASAATSGEWHRNDYGTGHERLICREAMPSWSCVYDNVPEPGVPGSDFVGHFTGRNVTDSWVCPTWFDASVCDNVVAVYRGVATYTSPTNHPVTVRQEYVVTNVDGQEIMQQYWVDMFYCPWFRTWEEALAADYNCTFAP